MKQFQIFLLVSCITMQKKQAPNDDVIVGNLFGVRKVLAKYSYTKYDDSEVSLYSPIITSLSFIPINKL